MAGWSSVGPSTAVFNNKLYMAWKGMNTLPEMAHEMYQKVRIMLKVNNAGNFSIFRRQSSIDMVSGIVGLKKGFSSPASGNFTLSASDLA
jgi:hypothetical protein